MLIFDMDGTLIDSNGIWRDVDIAFLEKRGLPYTKEYYEGVAHTIFPLAAVFTKEYCKLEESCEEIMAEWMDMAGDMYATSVTVKPGVREYLEQCRIRAAEERILAGDRIADVSFAVGYRSMSAFSAAFRRVTGQTPSETRKNSRNIHK